MQQPQPNQAHSATTTEELIVQYLDGELVRKELEGVLFGRLAESEDARHLMREHLMLRGAIRASSEDARFELSEGLDMRTRERIEKVVHLIPAQQNAVIAHAEDAAPVRTVMIARSLKRWAVRPSVAMLALLFAIGTTYFVTHTTDKPIASNTQISTPAPVAQAPAQQQSEVRIAAATPEQNVEQHAVPVKQVSHVARKQEAVQQFAQASAPAPTPVQTKTEPQSEPVMISKRYAKFLNASDKHEIVVTSRDRL